MGPDNFTARSRRPARGTPGTFTYIYPCLFCVVIFLCVDVCSQLAANILANADEETAGHSHGGYATLKLNSGVLLLTVSLPQICELIASPVPQQRSPDSSRPNTPPVSGPSLRKSGSVQSRPLSNHVIPRKIALQLVALSLVWEKTSAAFRQELPGTPRAISFAIFGRGFNAATIQIVSPENKVLGCLFFITGISRIDFAGRTQFSCMPLRGRYRLGPSARE